MAKRGAAEILLIIKEKGTEALKKVQEGFAGVASFAKKAAIPVTLLGGAIVKFAKDAAVLEDVRKSFENLTKSQGLNASKMLASMKKATSGTITEMELMKKANSAILLGLPIDRFDDMLKIARSSAKSTGESMDFMLNSIVTGLGRGSKLMLDNLGIMIKTEDAYEKYAKTLGTTAAKLTEAEKKQAFINEALSIGLENTEKAGEAQETAADQFAKFTTAVSEGATELGSFFLPTVAKTISFLTRMVNKVREFGASRDLKNFVTAGRVAFVELVATFDKFVAGIVTFPKVVGQAIKGLANFANIPKLLFKPDQVLKEVKKSFSKIPAILKETAAIHEAIEIKRAEDVAEIEKEHIKDTNQFAVKEAEKTTKKVVEIKKGGGKKQSDDQKKQEEKDRKRRKQAVEKERKEHAAEMNQMVETMTQTGLQGITTTAMGMIGENLLPGFGGAVSSAFTLLSKSTDEFAETLDQLFSVQFVENVAKNLIHLIEELPGIMVNIIDFLSENAPDLVKALVEALIANLPELTSAFVKAWIAVWGDPKFQASMIEAIGNGVISGFRDVAGDIKTEAQKIFGQAFAGVDLSPIEHGFNRIFSTLVEKFNHLFETSIARGIHIAFSTSVDSISNALKVAYDDSLSHLVEDFKFAFREGSKVFIQELSKAMKDIAEEFKRAMTGDFLGTKDSGGLDFGIKLPDISDLGGGFSFNHGGIVPAYAGGGPIDGTLARVTPGEFVVNRASTAANLDLLSSINQSRGRSVGSGGGVNIVVNGGLLGDKDSAREFALAVDEELTKLRQGFESSSFDDGIV
jgi:hypothetical protein